MVLLRRIAFVSVLLLVVVAAWLWPSGAGGEPAALKDAGRGETTAGAPQFDVAEPDLVRSEVQRSSVDVAQGRRDVPRGTRALSFQASIAGRVLREEDHAPSGAATVILSSIGDSAQARTTLTTEDGRYRFELERPGSYALRAHKGESAESPTVRVPVLEGSGALQAPALFLGEGTFVRGQVLPPLGRTLAAPARVYVLPKLSPALGPAGAAGVMIAHSDSQGTYSSQRAIPVDRRGGFVLAVVEGALGFSPYAALREGQTTLDVDVELLASDGFAVRVTDGAGSPISAAQVRVAPQYAPLRSAVLLGADRASADPILPDLFWKRTDEQGLAWFPELPVGGLFEYLAVVVAEGRPRAGPFAVSSPGIVEATLHMAELPQEIRGRITGPSGNPLGQVRIRVAERAAREFHAEPDGAFRYAIPEHERAQPCRLIVDAAGHCETSVVYWPGTSSAEDFDIALRRGGVLEGRVFDEEGEPVGGMRVTAWLAVAATPDFQHAITRGDGSFELTCIGDDPVLVRVASGYDSSKLVFRPQVEALATRGVELVLTMPAIATRPQTVRLVGLDPEGHPVPVQVADLAPRSTGIGEVVAVPPPRISVRGDDVLVSELHPADWEVRIEDDRGRVGSLLIERSQFSLPAVIHVPVGATPSGSAR